MEKYIVKIFNKEKVYDNFYEAITKIRCKLEELKDERDKKHIKDILEELNPLYLKERIEREIASVGKYRRCLYGNTISGNDRCIAITKRSK